MVDACSLSLRWRWLRDGEFDKTFVLRKDATVKNILVTFHARGSLLRHTVLLVFWGVQHGYRADIRWLGSGK